MKKMYKNPEIAVTLVHPVTIVCASVTGNNGGTQDLNGAGTGGGEVITD